MDSIFDYSKAGDNISFFHCSKKKFFSWIPTNLGKLDFSLVSHPKNSFLKNKSILTSNSDNTKKLILFEPEISDNIIFSPFFREIELLPIFFFTIDKTSNKKVNKGKASIRFYHLRSLDYLKKIKGIEYDVIYNFYNFEKFFIHFGCNFKVNENGKIKLFNFNFFEKNEDNNIKIENFNKNIINKELNQTIALALYTLIKRTIHGDVHHYQKIDIIIEVYKKFSPNKIMLSMLRYIKWIETFLKYANLKDNYSKGAYSYIQTFKNLFKKEITDKILIKPIGVLSSIDAINQKIVNSEAKKTYKVGWLISLTMLLVGIINIYKPNDVESNYLTKIVKDCINSPIQSFVILFFIYYMFYKIDSFKDIKQYIFNKFINKDKFFIIHFYHKWAVLIAIISAIISILIAIILLLLLYYL